MGAIASQITSLTIVFSTVYLDTDQRKHQSSASLAFVRGIHRKPVNSSHKWAVTRKMFPFDDVIMYLRYLLLAPQLSFLFRPFLARCDRLDEVSALRTLEYLHAENEYLPWQAAMYDRLPKIEKLLYSTNTYVKLQVGVDDYLTEMYCLWHGCIFIV